MKMKKTMKRMVTALFAAVFAVSVMVMPAGAGSNSGSKTFGEGNTMYFSLSVSSTGAYATTNTDTSHTLTITSTSVTIVYWDLYMQKYAASSSSSGGMGNSSGAYISKPSSTRYVMSYGSSYHEATDPNGDSTSDYLEAGV